VRIGKTVLTLLTFAALAAASLTIPASPGDSAGNQGSTTTLQEWEQHSQPQGGLSAKASARLHSEIESILRRPEFRISRLTREREAPAWLRWLRDKWTKFRQALAALSWLPAGASRWFLPAISILLGLALLYMVYRVARESLLGGHGGAGEVARRQATPKELLQQASASAERADYTEAIRLIFTATLLLLFPREAPRTPTRTLVYKLKAKSAALADDLMGLNGLFEVHYYGNKPASASGYQQALTISSHITKTMSGGSGESAS